MILTSIHHFNIMQSIFPTLKLLFALFGISFWFFSWNFYFLTLPICFCVLSAFSIMCFSTLITVLNFLIWLFQHPCYIWSWFWCLMCVFKLCFLPLSVSCNFLLKAGWTWWTDWVKETLINRLLVVWWDVGVAKHFIVQWLSQSVSELVFLDCELQSAS